MVKNSRNDKIPTITRSLYNTHFMKKPSNFAKQILKPKSVSVLEILGVSLGKRKQDR